MPAPAAGRVRLGGVEVGAGRPPLLVSSTFYERHSLVADAAAGRFDEVRAAALLGRAEAAADRFGVPVCHDVIALTAAAMARYVAFVARVSDRPFAVDAADPAVRAAGLEAAAAAGALHRCAYASLGPGSGPAEADALRRHPPAAVLVLAADPDDRRPAAALAVVARLRPLLERAGVDVPLVDVGVAGPASLAAAAAAVARVAAAGLPAGGAPGNAVALWPGLAPEEARLVLAGAVGALRAAGASWLHVGPVERAPAGAAALAGAAAS